MADEYSNGVRNWERAVIEKLASSALAEQRKARYWGILFKLLTFGYLFFLLFLAMGWIGSRDAVRPGEHSALVEVSGIIGPGSTANADDVMAGLRDAFKAKGTQGIILRINSPGGSPVQAATINDEIGRLRSMHPDIPVYAVVEDVCASGGYYVAVAADRIYVDKASIVGSIGVLMDGFGFTGTLEKLGVERRLLTSGDNKGFLDPFSPLEPGQRQHALQILDDIHQQFIDAVRAGRGERLKESPEVFSGLVWTGQRSIDMGLADALGGVDFVAREVIRAEHIVNFTRRENFAERLVRRFGAAVGEAIVSSVGPVSVR
ncbi:MAG TPA: S49 family peptidase [Burkholderiales bacterium]|nr:S49 family peptidase [Burkholderiales bacterium]